MFTSISLKNVVSKASRLQKKHSKNHCSEMEKTRNNVELIVQANKTTRVHLQLIQGNNPKDPRHYSPQLPYLSLFFKVQK